MKTIVHIIPSLSKDSGGPAQAIWQMTEAVKDDVESIILTTNEGLSKNELEDYQRLQNPKIYVFDYKGKHSFKVSSGLFRKAISLMNRVHTFHIHAGFSLISEWVALLCMMYKQNYVYRPLGTLSAYSLKAGNNILKRLALPVEKLILEQAKCVQATSASEKKDIERMCKTSDVRIIPPVFISTSKVRPKQKSKNENQLHLGFLSRIHPKKNLEFLFYCLSECKSLNWTLFIAGNGEEAYVEKLKNLAKELSIEKKIEWLGFIGSANKESFFEKIDWFVLPSLHENFGISVLEALNYNTPSIVSNQVEIADWFNSDQAKLFIKSIDLQKRKWIDVIHEIHSESQALYQDRLKYIATILKSTFSKEQLEKQLLEVYQA